MGLGAELHLIATNKRDLAFELQGDEMVLLDTKDSTYKLTDKPIFQKLVKSRITQHYLKITRVRSILLFTQRLVQRKATQDIS